MGNLFLLCLALPGQFDQPMKIDMEEIYTIIQNETELRNVQSAVCNIKLLDRCHSAWMCENKKEVSS